MYAGLCMVSLTKYYERSVDFCRKRLVKNQDNCCEPRLIVKGCTLTYNCLLFTTHCDLDGQLSHWHSYHILLFLSNRSDVCDVTHVAQGNWNQILSNLIWFIFVVSAIFW